MADSTPSKHPHGKRRYQSVAEGLAMAQAYLRSGLAIGEFARQNDVSYRMVQYWSTRARQLAAASEAAVAPQTAPRMLEHVAEVTGDGNIALAARAERAPSASPAVHRDDLPSTIEVRLSGGIRLAVQPGFSAALLKQVILAIEGSGAC
jgi:hypothetical protein